MPDDGDRARLSRLKFRDVSHYWRNLEEGNLRLTPLIVAFSIRVFTEHIGGSAAHMAGREVDSGSSPHQDLGLRPGQMVRVKSKHEIEATLNRNSRNRGLSFGEDMVSYCGGISGRRQD